MDIIKLVFPAMEHRSAAEEYKQTFFNCGEKEINGSALLDSVEYEKWLENTRNNIRPQTVGADWVTASTFFHKGT